METHKTPHEILHLLEGLICGSITAEDVVNRSQPEDEPTAIILKRLVQLLINERHQVRQQISQSEEKIILQEQEISRLKEMNTRFLRTVSHDLRAPLGGIAMAAELLLEPDPDWAEDERKAFIQDIIDQCRQLIDLINSLKSSASPSSN